MISTQLFEDKDIHLTAIDPEKDAAFESAWMHDLRYADLRRQGTYHPMSIFEVKKQFEEMQKESDQNGSQFYYSIRTKTDNRLIGFIHMPWIAWSHGSVFMRLLIAENEDLSLYGRQTLEIVLAYIFKELNLYRVSVIFPEYNREMIALYESAGFCCEVQMRDFYFHDGRYYDQLIFGYRLENYPKKLLEVQA
jgi:ribosomal-protein-alanine N-acetyltransferase